MGSFMGSVIGWQDFCTTNVKKKKSFCEPDLSPLKRLKTLSEYTSGGAGVSVCCLAGLCYSSPSCHFARFRGVSSSERY